MFQAGSAFLFTETETEALLLSYCTATSADSTGSSEGPERLSRIPIFLPFMHPELGPVRALTAVP